MSVNQDHNTQTGGGVSEFSDKVFSAQYRAGGLDAEEGEEDDNPAPTRPRDPFLDAGLGPDVWARVSPNKRVYWLFVLALAFGLTGFSWYWQTYWIPQQPLRWAPVSEFSLRQAIGMQRPILIWWSATDDSSADGSAVLNAAEATTTNRRLESALQTLDVEQARVRLRMKSAYLAKLDSFSEPAVRTLLQLESLAAVDEKNPLVKSGGLILWHPAVNSPEFVEADQVSVERVLGWLNEGAE